ncbi:TPA: hypothetical protein MO340_004262 [Salmonella enterica subsp. salamae serovar 35:g,m,s,t:-]|nr:hypothetical protein [Salmonella enterica subsp. salamae serovar 35:g,m,s,t:-]HCA3549732.1 hypothetical protein [Salmonella enterica subsp. salamae serovar 35:g,m,s,t:-]
MMKNLSTMTVKQLMEQLSKMPECASVFVQDLRQGEDEICGVVNSIYLDSDMGKDRFDCNGVVFIRSYIQ